MGCPAHILNNCLQRGMNILDLRYSPSCFQFTLWEENQWKSFEILWIPNISKCCIIVRQAGGHFFLQRNFFLLHMFSALKSFFLSHSKPPAVIITFFDSSFIEIYLCTVKFSGHVLWTVSCLHSWCSCPFEENLIDWNICSSLEF